MISMKYYNLKTCLTGTYNDISEVCNLKAYLTGAYNDISEVYNLKTCLNEHTAISVKSIT